MSTNPNDYFFELPDTGRPILHHLHQYWYPGVQAYWEKSTSSRKFDAIFGVKAIVIHATAGSSTYGAMSVMNPLINDGKNNINHWSLGIEIVNIQSRSDAFSDWQIEKTAEIVRYARAKYPNLKYVLSHAVMDPTRRTDPGTHFDWNDFKNRVLSGGGQESVMGGGFEDVKPMDHLETDYRESICGHDEPVYSGLESVAKVTEGSPVNWKQALLLARASEAVYEDKETAEEWAIKNLEADTAEFMDVKNTQLLIAENKHNMYIVFRGTKGMNDWVGNMRVNKTGKAYGKVHKGFFKAYSVVQEDVLRAISRARALGKKLYLAGHSLGGALASVSAADAYHEIGAFDVAGIYTYGMPKTCDRACADYVNSVFSPYYFRFVNDKDIIPRVPPGSQHVGRLFHFDNDGNLMDTSGEEGLESLETNSAYAPLGEAEFNQLTAAFKSNEEGALNMPGEGARDHSISNYVAVVGQQV